MIVTSFESLPKELFQLSMSLQVVGQGNEFEFASVLNSLLDCLILVQFLQINLVFGVFDALMMFSSCWTFDYVLQVHDKMPKRDHNLRKSLFC